jgi:hypothetical protein
MKKSLRDVTMLKEYLKLRDKLNKARTRKEAKAYFERAKYLLKDDIKSK